MKTELSSIHSPPAVKSTASAAPPAVAFIRDLLFILIAAWLARIFFVLIVPPEARSIDAGSWEHIGKILAAGGNPYKETALLNWPPLWLQAIYLMTKTATVLAVPFFRVLQISLVAVESLVLIALYKLIREVAPEADARKIVVVGLALNPAAVLLICQHGNFDVLVALWLILFMGSLLRYNRTGAEVHWLAACLFLGLGILTKTVPLVLAPLLAGGFRRMTRPARLLGLVLLLGPVSLGMSVIYVLAPADVTAKVLAYRSSSGWFGFSGLIQLAQVDNLLGVFNLLFYVLLGVIIIGLSVLFWRRQSIGQRETVLCAALLLAVIPALGPGYAPQYLYWYLPFLAATFAFYPGRWRWVLAAFGLTCAATYVIEYALFPSHGMFLIQMAHSGKLAAYAGKITAWSQTWSSESGQTLLRLPLFWCYLVLLCGGVGLFIRNLRAPSPPSSSS